MNIQETLTLNIDRNFKRNFKVNLKRNFTLLKDRLVYYTESTTQINIQDLIYSEGNSCTNSLTAQYGELIYAKLSPSGFQTLILHITLIYFLFQETLLGSFQECRFPAEEGYSNIVLKYFQIVRSIQEILNKHLDIFYGSWITECRFHHRVFDYFKSFRFREFPSALINVLDNKQINFNCFFKLYLLGHECHLTLQQSNYILTTLFSNLSNRITKVNTFDLRRNLANFHRVHPPLQQSLQTVFVILRSGLSIPSAPGMFGYFLAHKTFLQINCPL